MCADLARETHLVGHADHRRVLGGEFAHHGQHLARDLRIERRGRLIEEHHLGLHRQRSRDRYALLLPARELRRKARGFVGQANFAEQRSASRVGFGAAEPEDFARSERDVRKCGHVREQIELLKDHAHAAAQVDVFDLGIGHPQAVDDYLPAVDLH